MAWDQCALFKFIRKIGYTVNMFEGFDTSWMELLDDLVISTPLFEFIDRTDYMVNLFKGFDGL